MIDRGLIERCQRRERAAQREVYQALSGTMFGVCLRYVSNRMQAEDLLHDGFITLFNKIEDYRFEGPFEGWARRIFVNLSLGYIRRQATFDESTDSTELDIGVAAEVLSNMEARQIMDLIAQLPPGYRTILNLYSIEGYSHNEIAAELGISPETSRSQLSRAKAQLKNLLTQANLI